jgi:hypothetical protein
MEPKTDHENEIADRVDTLALAGELPASAVAEIAASLSFTMTKAESRFLVRYIVWRRDHPFPQ